jgi:hypothetical protein
LGPFILYAKNKVLFAHGETDRQEKGRQSICIQMDIETDVWVDGWADDKAGRQEGKKEGRQDFR